MIAPSWYALERDVADLCARLYETGVPFDQAGAQALLATFEADTAALADQLQADFPPVWVEETFIPKRDNKTRGYKAGVPFLKRRLEPFNPGSGAQVAARLIEKHQWQPAVFTDAGAPATKTAVLQALDYPEARTLCRHKLVQKRISMMTGDKGWLNSVNPQDGRLHTQYFSHGTVTGRCTHKPNISQVPKVVLGADKQPLRGIEGSYGAECRALFGPRLGWWMVGADMSGLELRCLAHYLAMFDDGAYARAVCDGDPHAVTQAATGLTSRSKAKTLIYACLYGCGDYRAGTIVEPEEEDVHVVREIGHATKQSLVEGIAGFGDLFQWIDATLQDSRLPGLDGRTIYVRKHFAALNSLLQSCGAILCKRWLLLCEDALQAEGLRHGEDYELLIYNHDEQQFGARTLEIGEIISRVTVEQAVRAGEWHGLRCPTAGEAKIGRNWAETH